jgi:BMFP domain-containing protein YqiC
MPYGRPQAYGYDPQAELQFLQQQAAGWRQNLEQLEVRIKQLEDQLQQKQQAD